MATTAIDQFNAEIAKSDGQDLNGACAALGYTRGTTHRGRVVLTGPAIIVAECASAWDPMQATREFTTVAEADAYVTGKRPSEQATIDRLRGHNEADAERRALDSGY